MENYNNEISEKSGVHPHQRGNYSYANSSILVPNNNNNNNSSSTTFPSSPSVSMYVGRSSFHHQDVKTENGIHQHFSKFHYPLLTPTPSLHNLHRQAQDQETTTNNSSFTSTHQVEEVKAKIIAHPRYSNLLQAFLSCQKVGAPPEVAARLAATYQEFEARRRALTACRDTSKDPELDQFMEVYCDMLVKYKEELARPVQEAMDFMRRIEAQLNMISNGCVSVLSTTGVIVIAFLHGLCQVLLSFTSYL